MNEDETASITLTASDADGDTLSYQIVSSPTNGALTGIAPNITYTPAENYNGSDAFTFRVNDGTIDSNDATVTITVNPVNDPPTVSFSASPATITQGGSSELSWTFDNAQSAHIDNGIGIVSTGGTISVSPEHTTTYTLSVTGPTGSANAQATVKVTGNPEPQPDGSFGDQYEDLIPPDSTVDEYDPERFSLITGIVHAIDDSPIQDVSVTIHSHPEYGTVPTDTTGRFSIPVEGGGTMTVVYQKEGLITAHRKIYVPWNDIAIAETLQMIAEDPVSTTFTFDGNPATVATHQSTEVTDEFGSRSLSMVFTGDNTAWLMDENGNDIHPLETITIRLSEYTTLDSMPAVLPPTSAYTYCSELSVDGAQRVRFDKPVITWIENFLKFAVGVPVPVGFYDRDKGVWVPSDNGVVVKLLDTNADGLVDALDADGDDQPDDLNANGFFSDEVAGLEDTEKYLPDTTFWRSAITHFSPCDWNWPYRLAADAIAPNSGAESIIDQKICEEKDCKRYSSSFVEERSRIFHEDILIPGTDMYLHYASNRVRGYKIRVIVPAIGETIPSTLKSIIVKMKVAGRRYETTVEPQPNQIVEFGWDGWDYLGREVRFSTPAQIEIGFVYEAVYGYTGGISHVDLFGLPGDSLTPIPSRQEIIYWKKSSLPIQSRMRSVGSAISNGWTISPHHSLNMKNLSILHKGDGTMVENNVTIINTVAGNGVSGYSGDGGPSTDAQLYIPFSVTIDSAGKQYIADTYNHRIRKVDTDGIITTVAGNGIMGYNGDGILATEATLNYPKGITIDASGNLYIADSSNFRIRKVDASGIITTVAGGGPTYGDGLATQRILYHPGSVAVDTWGNLYIADSLNHRIRKVDPNGIMTTVAGSGYWGPSAQGGFSGDGGPAVEAELNKPSGIGIDPSGNIFFVDSNNQRVRKIDNSGIISTVAGSGNVGFGNGGYDGDGELATEALLNNPHGLAVDATGSLFIADKDNNRIRKVNTNGIITTIAGDGVWGYNGDGGSAIAAQINCISVASDSAGNIFIAGLNTIRKVGPYGVFLELMETGDIPFSEKDSMGHIMSSSGQHKTTFDLETGITIREFEYDVDNNLNAIIDQFGNQTIINRDGNGVPTSIVSPDGITTMLTIDGSNHLTGITYPGGNNYSFEYTLDGLMTAMVEPAGNRFEHQFNSHGRLTDATDEEGGHWNYQRIGDANGNILTEVTSGEGNLTAYLDDTDSTGAYTSTITGPTGADTQYSQSANGFIVNKSLPCGMDLSFIYDVDSEYKFKYVKEMHETTPSGLEKIVLREKAYEDTNSDEIKDLITKTVSVNDKTTTLVNDVLQSEKAVTTPEGRKITMQYDPATLLTESVNIPGLNATNYGYNPQGRIISVSTGTRQATFSYNPQGFMDSVTDPEDYTATYTYDAVGRVTGVGRPDGSSLGFTYDGNGNMTVLTNPSSIQHGFGFNAVNMNSSYQTPISGTYSYVYDRDRRLTEINFPSGRQIRGIYDTIRLSQVQTPEGNIDYTYLCGTTVESITKGTEAITFGYDGKLITSETLTGTLNQSLGYTYNNDFNVTGFTYAGGTDNYTYDNDGLLTGAGSFTITRNAQNGLPEALNGGTLSQSRTFNGYGEQDGQVSTISGQGVSSWSLAQNDNGQIMQKIETVDGVTSNYDYTYDPMGRLLTVIKDASLVEEYDYDLNGTRIYEMNTLRGISGRSFTYSNEDHLLTAGTASYQYDVDGFLTTRTDGAEVTNYNYSSRGELLSVTLPDGRVIEYIHDPLGRRIAKIVDGITVEKYLWQGLTRLLAVYNGSDSLTMRFEYADSRMPVAMTRGGATYYLTYDQVGSLKAVADSAGNVVKYIEYDSFGNIINDTNTAFDMPFGFAGGLHDRDTGFVRFGYRDFDPDTGRWTAKDPILFAGGDTDLYGYVLNDPVNKIDPVGLAGGGMSGWGNLPPGQTPPPGSIPNLSPINPSDLVPSEKFLSGTETASMVFAAASAVTGNVLGASVFGGINLFSGMLKSSLYSDTPCNDSAKEGMKQIIPAPPGLGPVKDKIVDQSIDWYIDEFDLPEM
jgi:RHS repeat-associated protein